MKDQLSSNVFIHWLLLCRIISAPSLGGPGGSRRSKSQKRPWSRSLKGKSNFLIQRAGLCCACSENWCTLSMYWPPSYLCHPHYLYLKSFISFFSIFCTQDCLQRLWERTRSRVVRRGATTLFDMAISVFGIMWNHHNPNVRRPHRRQIESWAQLERRKTMINCALSMSLEGVKQNSWQLSKWPSIRL